MNIDFNQGIPNTFGLEVKAQQWVEYASVAELLDFIQAGKLAKPYIHVGSGSNLLFLNDFQGTVLHSALRAISLEEDGTDEVLVRAGAGVIWDDFVDYCVEHQYYGAENLSLVPGEVGSSVVQNIGAYGVEVKDLVAWIETVNDQGEQRIYQPEECEFAYRKSLFKRPEMKSVFVTEVVFRLQKTERYKLDYGTIRQELARYPEINLKAVRQAIIDIRRSKLPDPEELGNAGSFFMNPIVPTAQFEALLAQYPDMPHYPVGDGWVKIPAGWMIERCGWKGQSLGPAGVYEKQALVLVNLGGATGADIVALSDAVRASVRQKFGIEIYPEVNFIS